MRSASSVSPTVLTDTNVLVYAYDPQAGTKHEASLGIVEELLRSGKLVLSAQVLNEFYSVATRPLRGPGLTHQKARSVLSELCAGCVVLPLTKGTTFRAIDAVSVHGLSFWDALIWAVAAENGVSVVYSEDFQHGRVVDGVRFCNPFEAQA